MVSSNDSAIPEYRRIPPSSNAALAFDHENSRFSARVSDMFTAHVGEKYVTNLEHNDTPYA
jgi:hypothetical protein